jgi:hypothetical protein
MNSRVKVSYLLRYSIIAILLLVIESFAIPTASMNAHAYAVSRSGQSQNGDNGVIFKTPKGYMPLDFPEIKGVLMITQKRPSGMFIVYPSKDQSVDQVSNKVRETIEKMFVHGGKSELKWNASALAGHEGISDETGTLALGTGNEQDVQIATYTRTIGAYTYLYGYFAMRNKNSKSKEQSGDFLDNSGKGVKEFDEFWRSISKRK